MSIPAKVILGGDLDTIGRLRSGRFDDPFMPSMDRPYGEGLILTIPPYSNYGEVTYVAPYNMELHRVHFDTNRYLVEDTWSLHINDDVEKNYILRKFHQKNYTEGLQLMSVIKLKKGDRLTFKLKSTDTSKGIRAEISMAFLVEGKDKKGNGTATGITEYSGLHISYNLFGAEHGNAIHGTSLFDEAVPFLVKGGKDYYRSIEMTGTHTELAPEGKFIMSMAHNIPRTIKVFYDKGSGNIDSIQLKKDWMYVSIPNNIYESVQTRAKFLNEIDSKFSDYEYYSNRPYRVRGLKQSYMENITKITIT